MYIRFDTMKPKWFWIQIWNKLGFIVLILNCTYQVLSTNSFWAQLYKDFLYKSKT